MAQNATYKNLYLDNGTPIIYADLPTVTGTYRSVNDVITVLFTRRSLASVLVNDGDTVQYTFINGAILRATKQGSVANIEFSDREAENWENLTDIILSGENNPCLMLLTNENRIGTYGLEANTDIFTLSYEPVYSSGSPGQGYFNKRGTFNAQYAGWNENAYSIIVLGNTAPDPYGEGGNSGVGGGTGTFSGTGDAIGIPSLPTLSAVSAGFITLFNPTISQMSSLASYMWSDLFDIDGWKKVFADPMQAILGLSIVPVNVPNGGAEEVKVGNISTGVQMNVAGSQYVEVDCGTLNVQEYWGAYLDYDPYTKAEIYLPYIGTHALAVDDIMNKSVHVVYHVDILSGACCAYVQCGGTVLYTFVGQCSCSVPITGDNWTNVINGALGIAGSIGQMVATGGATAPMAITGIASTAVNTMKPSVEKSGAMGGMGGMMGVQTPYLILTRPRQALPERQNSFTGYPSFITEPLGSLTGYTEVFKIHLENVPATEQELSEIETLLKTGVIF